jgi:hypothetical protein
MDPETHTTDSQFECIDRGVGALLPQYLDGELDDHQRQRFEAHLKCCARCSEDLLLRESISGMISSDWPALSNTEAARDTDASGHGGGFSWRTVFLEPRVPTFVPLVLVLIAIAGFLLVRNRSSFPMSQWFVVNQRVEYFVPLATRGAPLDEPTTCRVAHGQELVITLASVPAVGMPLYLVIHDPGARAARPGLPFRLVEGFPVLTVIVPDLPPGTYPCTIVGGHDRQPIHSFVLTIADERAVP